MKTINFDEYKKRRGEFAKIRARLGLKRGPARKPRDKNERRLLLRIDKSRWNGWIASGKIEKLGKRVYKIN